MGSSRIQGDQIIELGLTPISFKVLGVSTIEESL
jgi:hypothetical protein